jgi:hypothetical protein
MKASPKLQQALFLKSKAPAPNFIGGKLDFPDDFVNSLISFRPIVINRNGDSIRFQRA